MNAIRHFPNEQTLDFCPACRSKEIEPFVVSGDFHYGIDGDFSTSKCRACGSAFMNPMPSVEDLTSLYPDDYYSYQTPTEESSLRRSIRTFLRYPRVYTVPPFRKPGTMLDVGCGAGHYLLEMRRRGWKVFGAELSKGAALAGQRAGLDIRGGELTDAGFAEKSFDFVRSNHSFEHIPNPDDVLREMRRILKDDGYLFIGIPNLDSAWGKMFGRYWWNFGLPVHTMNYTTKGITQSLERNGFKVDKVHYNSDWSGFSGSVQIAMNARRGVRRPDGAFVGNRVIRMPLHYLSKLMDVFRKGDCIEVIAQKA